MSLLVFNEMIYTKLVPLITHGFLCCGTPKLTKKKVPADPCGDAGCWWLHWDMDRACNVYQDHSRCIILNKHKQIITSKLRFIILEEFS